MASHAYSGSILVLMKIYRTLVLSVVLYGCENLVAHTGG